MATIWSPSSASPFASTASIRSPSPSKATPRSSSFLRTSSCSARRSVAPQPTLMFVPFGFNADCDNLRPAVLERPRRDRRVRAVGAVDSDPQPDEVGAEAVEHVVEVAVDRDLEVVDLPELGIARLGVEQRLDLLLLRVVELAPVAVEELDAVVLGRVVRRGDDDPEVEREQRDRRRRQDPCQHRVPARGRDAAGEGALELRPGAARVAADEDRTAADPERGRPAEPLDELRGSGPRRRLLGHRRCRSNGAAQARG